jgi:hypothetical protein
MEIETLHFNDLQNEEHVQFGTDFVTLVQTNGPDKLTIGPFYNVYSPLFDNEQTAFKKILKSPFTEDLVQADSKRDFTFRGISDDVTSKLRHFDPNQQAAAKRLKVVFDTYGNLSRKALDKETAGITKLIAELRANYAEEIATLGLADWIARLEAENNTFSGLALSRYSEEESKTQLNMKEVRTQVDDAYRKIVKRINALIEINGEEAHAGFVLALNLRIQHYNNLIARRQGHNGSDAAPASAS